MSVTRSQTWSTVAPSMSVDTFDGRCVPVQHVASVVVVGDLVGTDIVISPVSRFVACASRLNQRRGDFAAAGCRGDSGLIRRQWVGAFENRWPPTSWESQPFQPGEIMPRPKPTCAVAPTLAELRRALPRGGTDVNAVLETVTPVVQDADRGVEAALNTGEVRRQTVWCGFRPTSSKAGPTSTPKWPMRCVNRFPGPGRCTRPVPGHHPHRRRRRWHSEREVDPVAPRGLYVPGGNAVYPSSVIMNVVPAQEAGVGSLVVASPPQKDFGGWPHLTILATSLAARCR